MQLAIAESQRIKRLKEQQERNKRQQGQSQGLGQGHQNNLSFNRQSQQQHQGGGYQPNNQQNKQQNNFTFKAQGHQQPQQQFNFNQQQNNTSQQSHPSNLSGFFKNTTFESKSGSGQQSQPQVKANLSNFFKSQIQSQTPQTQTSQTQNQSRNETDKQPYKKQFQNNQQRNNNFNNNKNNFNSNNNTDFNNRDNRDYRNDDNNINRSQNKSRPRSKSNQNDRYSQQRRFNSKNQHNYQINQSRNNSYQNRNNYNNNYNNNNRYNNSNNTYQKPSTYNKVQNQQSNYNKPHPNYNKDNRSSNRQIPSVSMIKKQSIGSRFQNTGVKRKDEKLNEQESEQEPVEEEHQEQYQNQGEYQQEQGEGKYQGQEYEEEQGQGQGEYQDQGQYQGQKSQSPQQNLQTLNQRRKRSISPQQNNKAYTYQVKGTYIPLRLKSRKNYNQKQIIIQKQYADTMCPIDQFYDRQTIFRNNNKTDRLVLDLQQWFSFFQIDKKTRRPTIQLAIKRFARSTGAETVIRTPKTLKKTIDYILQYIIDSDTKPIQTLPFIGPVDSPSIKYHDIYNFLWNRLRAMIIDITEMPQQMYYSKECITCLQIIARFYFFSINERRKEKHTQLIDEKINRDRISQTLSGLMSSYKHSRMRLKVLVERLKEQNDEVTDEIIEKQMKKQKIYLSSNEPQMLSYALIYQKDLLRLETFYQQFKQFPYNPLIQSPQIKLSIQVIQARTSSNYHKVFQLLQSDRMNYLTASCLLNWIFDLRCEMMQTIHNNWRSSEIVEGCSVVGFELLDKYLRFKGDRAELVQFIYHIGGQIDSKETCLLKKGFQKLVEGYVPPYYQFEKNKLRRGLYGLGEGGNGVITRQELVGGYWKNDNYQKTIIGLFREKDKQVSVQKVVAPLIVRGEKERETLKLTVQTKQIIKQGPVEIQEDKSPIITIAGKSRQQQVDQQKLEQQQRLYNKIKRKKAIKNNQSQLSKFTKIPGAEKQLRLEQAIKDGLIYIGQKLNLKLKQYSFGKLRSVIKELQLKKSAFRAIQMSANNNKQIWKNYSSLDKDNLGNTATEVMKKDSNSRDKLFTAYIIQSLLNHQKPYLTLESSIKFRILLLVNKSNFSDNSKINYMKQLIKYLVNYDQCEWYDKYVNEKGKNSAVYERLINFSFENEKRQLLLTIQCNTIQFQQKSKRRVRTIIEKQSYGADMIIIPIINEPQKQQKILKISKQIKQSNTNLDNLQFLIPILQSKQSPFTVQNQKLSSKINNIYSFYIDPQTQLRNPCHLYHFYASLQKIVKRKSYLPPLSLVSLAYQLGTMLKNMKYVRNEINDSNLEYYYYELYVEECLDQLKEATELVFSAKESIVDWRNMIENLMKLNHREVNIKSSKISINAVSTVQEKTIMYLLECIKIKLVDQSYYKQNKKKQCLLKKSLIYLSQFVDKDILEMYYKRIEVFVNKSIQIGSTQLPQKNIKEMFEHLLYCVITQLQDSDIYMVLPNNFEFVISENFEERVRNRYQETLKSINKKKPIVERSSLEEMLKQRNAPEKMPFVYEHEDWVDLICKRRKTN